MTAPVPLPVFLAPKSPAYSSELLDELEVTPEWLLLDDVIAEVIAAWTVLESGNLRRANAAVGGLVASLRTRREAIEAAARK